MLLQNKLWHLKMQKLFNLFFPVSVSHMVLLIYRYRYCNY